MNNGLTTKRTIKPLKDYKTGRKDKKTDFVINKLARSLRQGNTIADSCRVAGITTPTYYKWMEEDEDISNVLQSAKAEYFTTLRKSVHREAKHDGNLAHKVLQSEGQYEKDLSNKPIIINIGADTITVNAQDGNL